MKSLSKIIFVLALAILASSCASTGRDADADFNKGLAFKNRMAHVERFQGRR